MCSTPVSVSVPVPFTVIPPVPPMTPAKVPVALVSVSVLAPSVTTPVAAPDSDLIEVLLPEIEVMMNVPSSCTPLENWIAPLPDSVRLAPLLTVVAPE